MLDGTSYCVDIQGSLLLLIVTPLQGINNVISCVTFEPLVIVIFYMHDEFFGVRNAQRQASDLRDAECSLQLVVLKITHVLRRKHEIPRLTNAVRADFLQLAGEYDLFCVVKLF